MSELPYLFDLVVIFAVGVLAALLAGLLRLPAIAGFMIAGAVIGPFGIGLVPDAEIIRALAEIGVVLLLFSIGLEFSFSRLRRIGGVVAIGGALQVGLTIAATVAVGRTLGLSVREALFYGLMVALSSTAIVLRGLGERGELDAPHGRLILGTLLLQDLAVVPMMLLLPVLAGTTEQAPTLAVGLALGQAAALLALTLVVGRVVIPRLFAWVDRSKSREVFSLAVLAVAIGTAWLTSMVGLSLALGAFLAGVLLAESEYAHRALGQVLPLRDVFASLFFMSLGMLLDVRVIAAHPAQVLAVFAAIFIGKALIASLAAMAMRFPARVAFLSGMGLAQFGEFGFVLAEAGRQLDLLHAEQGGTFLAGALLTMLVTPLSLRVAPHLTAGAALLRPLEKLIGARGVTEVAPLGPSGHVLVAGMGLAGRLLTNALTDCGVPYLAIDLNAETVRAAVARGEPAYYGDVTSDEILEYARLPEARAMVLLISDSEAARRAIAVARRVAPEVPIFYRTKYLRGHQALRDTGVQVVSEELEAGLEVLARVLRSLEVPGNIIKDEVSKARSLTQASARTTTVPRRRLPEIAELEALKIESILVQAGAEAAGHSPAEMQLRSRSGALIVALKRGSQLITDPDPTQPLLPGDIIYVVGNGDAVRRATQLLGEPAAEPRAPV